MSSYFTTNQRLEPFRTCPDGFNDVDGNGNVCEDKNECDSNPCSAHSQCLNTDGSYECSCDVGYSGDGLSGDCTDINECSSDATVCDNVSDCVNTPGSYECNCHVGYKKNSGNCVDIDECAIIENICEANEKCVNNAGGFSCTCNNGYYKTADGCSDFDEMMLVFESANEEGYFRLKALDYTFPIHIQK